jgi:hypothetical protein
MFRMSMERNSPRRYFVALVFCLLFCSATSSSASASCGDYLLHSNPVKSNSPDSSIVGFDWLTVDSLPLLPPEKSACANGRCQSAPLSGPIDPQRIVFPRQSAIAIRLDSNVTNRQSTHWGFPTDGMLPESPFIEASSPPPESC